MMAEYKSITGEAAVRESVAGLYRSYGNGDSAHCFESLWIWKDAMKLSICLTEDLYAVLSDGWNGRFLFFPVGSEGAKKQFVEEAMKGDGISFRYMTQEDVRFMEQFFPERFSIRSCPDESEYIMDRTTMEMLPGKVFSRERGHISQLRKKHDVYTQAFGPSDAGLIRDIVFAWAESHQWNSRLTDTSAVRNVVENMADLGVHGVIAWVDDLPAAVAAGFRLDNRTVDCCLQKNSVRIQGLSYYLRQEFARRWPSDVRFFNWEEDLGIEGLRQAKTLMRPCGMIDMFACELRR